MTNEDVAKLCLEYYSKGWADCIKMMTELGAPTFTAEDIEKTIAPLNQ